jgi:hypothetical protein
MFNQTAVREWAQETAECIPANGLDGVLLDQEAIDLDFNQTGKQSLKTNCLTLLIWIVSDQKQNQAKSGVDPSDRPGTSCKQSECECSRIAF